MTVAPLIFLLVVAYTVTNLGSAIGWFRGVRALDWRGWVIVLAIFLGVPMALVVIALAVFELGFLGAVWALYAVLGVMFLAGLSHEWWQNWRAERRRLSH